jgi:hypothetical protein
MRQETEECRVYLRRMIRDIDVNSNRRKIKLVINKGITRILDRK